MKKLLLLTAVFLFFGGQQTISGYCNVTPTGNDFISNVSIGSLTNSTGLDGYADYTVSGPTCTLTTCNSITLLMSWNFIIPFHSGTITNMVLSDYYLAAWIDYNNNNVFDANEKLGEVISPFSSVNYPIAFTIPSTVTSGIKRLRIMLAYSTPGLNPCNSYQGEVEDYAVFINLAHPNPVVGSNSPVCMGKIIQLNASGGVSYSWSGPSSFTSFSQNPSISIATPANTGAYTVTMVGSNGCTASATTTVTVNPAPNPSQGSNSPLCVGDTLNLTSGGGSTYSWSGPNSFHSTVQNPSINNVTLNHNGNYIVTVTNTGGCTSTSGLTVTVYSRPVVTSSSNSPLCDGSDLQLNSGGGFSYSWSGPDSFASNVQNPFIPAVDSNNAGSYVVVVTNLNGCTSSASVQVVIHRNPSANAGNNFGACEGDTARLHGSGGTSYSWTGPNGFTSLVQNPFFNSVIPGNEGLYVLTVLNTFGCNASSSVYMSVFPLPVISLGSNSPVCSGSDINLSASGGTVYSWHGPHGFTSTDQNPVIDSTTSLNAGFYSVTVSENNCSSVDSINVLIKPLPVISAGSSSPVCPGDSLLLNASGGQSYTWTGPNNFQSLLQNPLINSASPSDSGNYIVTGVDSNGCAGDSMINVIVINVPAITATVNSPCIGDSLIFNSAGGSTYSWTGPNGFVSALQNPFIAPVSLLDSGFYIVTSPDSTSGCNSIDSAHAVLFPNPVVNLGNDTAACPGTLILNAENPGASYLWNNSTTNSTISVTSSGTYSVMATMPNGCFDSDTIIVTLHSLPVVSLTLNLDTVCITAGEQFLSGGSPSNGYYSGPGVIGLSFEPSVAGVGNQLISYGVVDSVTGCSNIASDTIYVSSCVGIEELSGINFYTLYPNPFNSNLTIVNQQSQRTGKINIELMTVESRIIRRWNNISLEKYVLTLGDLPAGIYFLILKSEDKNGFFRVVKEE